MKRGDLVNPSRRARSYDRAVGRGRVSDGNRVVLLEEDGSFSPGVAISITAQWIAPPYGYCWPVPWRLDGGRPFNNLFGFLRT